MRKTITSLLTDERGHAGPVPGMLLGAAGAIALAIGAAGDTDWLTITGGIVLAVAMFAIPVLNHMLVEYDIYGRLEKLEK